MTSPTRTFSAFWRTEATLFLREPFAVGFTIVLPLGLLLVFGAAFGSQDAGNGFTVADIQVPSLIAIVLTYVAFGGVPIVFAEYRELGVFRAYRVTPVRMPVFVAAHVVVHLLMCAFASLLAALVTWLVFGLHFGGHPALFAAVAIGSAAVLFAAGYLVAALPLGARTAQSLGSSVYFLFIFTSGATLPRARFPAWLQSVTDWLPMTVVVDTLHGAWTGSLGVVRGLVTAGALLLLGAAAAAVAARNFKAG